MSGASMSAAEAIGSAVRRNGHLIPGATALTPYDVMAAREEAEHSDEERRIREEAHSEWLCWIFEGGAADLERAAKRLLSYARRYRPDLVSNMSMAEAGALFGQGRAAVQAREKRMFEPEMERAGYRSTQLPGGKNPRSRAKMAAAQKGNHHRARSAKPAIL